MYVCVCIYRYISFYICIDMYINFLQQKLHPISHGCLVRVQHTVSLTVINPFMLECGAMRFYEGPCQA